MPAPGAVIERRVTVASGVSVAVRVHPPAKGSPAETSLPVLAVHGLSSNATLWDGVADFLAARGHPVAAVDQRGHGRSDKPSDGYDFATLSDDLVAVLDELGWTDPARAPVVAGQSWGANVVVELAALHPERVGALVLVDGGTIELSGRFADWPTCEAALAPPRLEGTPAEQMEGWLRAAHPDWPDGGIAASMANVEVLPDGTVRPWLSRANHMTILRHLWDHHPSARWSVLAMPVLILAAGDPAQAGGRFDAGKRQELELAARSIRRGVLRWMAGDHDLHAQHPNQVGQLIDDVGSGTLPPPVDPV